MLPPEALITFLPVRDLNATHQFYGEILGLSLTLDQGTCRIYRIASSAFVAFCLREVIEAADGVIVTLVTSDVDGWYNRLVENGIKTDDPPRHNPKYNIYHFFTRDPDGWTVEVQRFEDPHWAEST